MIRPSRSLTAISPLKSEPKGPTKKGELDPIFRFQSSQAHDFSEGLARCDQLQCAYLEVDEIDEFVVFCCTKYPLMPTLIQSGEGLMMCFFV